MKIYLCDPISRYVESSACPSKEDVFPHDGRLYEVVEVRWVIIKHQQNCELPSLEAEVYFKELVL